MKDLQPQPDESDLAQEVHHRHLYEGEPEEDLVEALEPDQLVAAMESRLPPVRLTRWQQAGLWALRIGLVVISALVVYTFIASVTR